MRRGWRMSMLRGKVGLELDCWLYSLESVGGVDDGEEEAVVYD
jgi:hypothetical protein